MDVLYGQKLVDTVSRLSNRARNRVWIASPYIGNIGAITRLLGQPWYKELINIRMLTDIEECSKDATNFLSVIFHYGKIRTLRGLHAKIYIFDETAIVTSANLTESAFTKRHEMGVMLNAQASQDAIEAYDSWWSDESISKPIRLFDIEGLGTKKGGRGNNDSGSGLKVRWKLPKQKAPSARTPARSSDYNYFVECYEIFAKNYKKLTGSKNTKYINFEIDEFLDYLFHGESAPSQRYRVHNGRAPEPRKVDDLAKAIKEHLSAFKDNLEWMPIPAITDMRYRCASPTLRHHRVVACSGE